MELEKIAEMLEKMSGDATTAFIVYLVITKVVQVILAGGFVCGGLWLVVKGIVKIICHTYFPSVFVLQLYQHFTKNHEAYFLNRSRISEVEKAVWSLIDSTEQGKE